MDSITWAEAFEKLAETRGVADRLRGKGGRPEENAATVAALSKEVGVPESTARHRLQMAEELKTHPDYFRKTAKPLLPYAASYPSPGGIAR